MKFFCMPYCSALKVKAAHLSKILVNFMELRDVTHQECTVNNDKLGSVS